VDRSVEGPGSEFRFRRAGPVDRSSLQATPALCAWWSARQLDLTN